ncbi:MAG: precorrin-6y C5,15-methyltransferase (decarboxylating) subunit CbiE [Thermodesulfobacteriota bacterium]
MIYVIGVGLSGRESLSKKSLRLIEGAGMLVGGGRHIGEFPGFKGRRVDFAGGLQKAERAIKAFGKKGRVVVLATGDPGLYGVGAYMVKRFGKGSVRIVPNVSVVQEAFARIKEDWNGAAVVSVHGRGGRGGRGMDRAIEEIIKHKKAAVYTDPKNTPAAVARAMVESGAGGYKVFLCESLGQKGEKVTSGTLGSIARRKKFAPLNVMILIKKDNALPEKRNLPPFGLPDKLFARAGGMITKEEIRTVSLSKLSLRPDSTVWDIGSGSGSVAIEAARLAPGGEVYAIEKSASRVKDIRKNKKTFRVGNLHIIHGTAPACLTGGKLPSPDSVFIGGGGAGLPEIFRHVCQRLKPGGRLVVNAVTMETIGEASRLLKKRGWEWDVVSMNIARKKNVGELSLLNAENPVFIITAVKP